MIFSILILSSIHPNLLVFLKEEQRVLSHYGSIEESDHEVSTKKFFACSILVQVDGYTPAPHVLYHAINPNTG